MGEDFPKGGGMTIISLFHANRCEHGARIPNRPLEEVSDFVVEQMPDKLTDIRAGRAQVQSLACDVEAIIAELSKAVLEQHLLDADALSLAALDVKLLEAGIVHSGGTPPPNLVTTVNTLADVTDRLPTLTYEDLVLINPSQDRRTFTNGETGQSEADFYEGHRIIEGYMREVLGRFLWAMCSLSEQGKRGIEKATLSLEHAVVHLRTVLEYVETIGMAMNKDDFALFRVYFQAHPLRQTKGASGAFSASVPTVDLLLGGENLATEYLTYVQQNMPYFPRNGRKELHRALEMVQTGFTLNSLYQAAGKPEELGRTLRELSHCMRIFRGKHYKAVAYQLPKVMSGEEVGSGRETGAFLHERIGIRHIT